MVVFPVPAYPLRINKELSSSFKINSDNLYNVKSCLAVSLNEK